MGGYLPVTPHMITMDSIRFGTNPTLYPLTTPPGFTITEGELYNPDTGSRVDSPAATEYDTSFLVPIDEFAPLRDLIQTNYDTFKNTGEIVRTSVTVASTDNLAVKSGVYNVFWVTPTYERYHDRVLVTLKGFGEPDSSTVAPNQTFTVIEGVPLGTVVGTVKGFKPGMVLESRPDVPFAYDAVSGILSVSGKIDYEATQEWSLAIGGTEVTVWVLDAVENPVTVQSTYTFYLAPDTQPGTVAGTVTAERQGDTGALPVYSLVSGNTGGWAIDSFEGAITYLGGQPLVDGQVLGVTYGGAEPVTVTLRVLPPTELSLPILRFSLPPNLSDGQLVGNVGAVGVQTSLVHPGFGVVDSKLQVQDKSQIGPGLTELSIELKGEGRSGTQSVFVVVANHPKVNEFWLAEDATNGTGVGQVELPEGGLYTVTPTTVFNINSGTGELLVTSASGLSVGSYSLTISRGTSTTVATVKVYAVLSENSVEFTVSATAPTGMVVGTLTGSAPFTASTPTAPYTLNSTTGVITLTTTPAVALGFSVTDGAGDTSEVEIALESATATGQVGFIGAVYAGQQGQAVATRAGVLFSVGSVGFGQSNLSIKPDNLGGVSRNTEGKIVSSKAAGLQLTTTARATPAMVVALKALWALPLETLITVGIPGEDFVCTLVNFERSVDAEGVSVTLELRT